MNKQKTILQLKKILDKLVSEYVRRRDADFNGYISCYTCGVKKHWKEIQCGHYISRTYSNLRWSLENLRPQCYSCNVMRHGNMDEYALRLEREHPGTLEVLSRWKVKTTPLKYFEMIELIDEFKKKLKNLGSSPTKD